MANSSYHPETLIASTSAAPLPAAPTCYRIHKNGEPYHNGSSFVEYHFLEIATDFCLFCRSLNPAAAWTVIDAYSGEQIACDEREARLLAAREEFEQRELLEA